jgi:hypothetical protein
MANEAKHKHLDFIQGVINRMANNSFQLKSWTIGIISAIFALAANKDAEAKSSLLLISIIPLIIFWILDGYFLWQERMFRELYKEIAAKNENEIDYQMNIAPYNNDRNTWIKCIFSKTLNVFYFSLFLLMAFVTFMMLKPS